MDELQLRSRASTDVDAIVVHLITEASSTTALGFVDALEAGLRHIASTPGSGSLKFGYELGIPELRAWRLRRQPFVVFHVPFDDRIDVWRVLHARRDIPASFDANDRL